jgi:hypothetical protein
LGLKDFGAWGCKVRERDLACENVMEEKTKMSQNNEICLTIFVRLSFRERARERERVASFNISPTIYMERRRILIHEVTKQ